MSSGLHNSFSLTSGASGRREPFLDGIRGLAAMYVVAHHAFLEVGFVPHGRGGTLAAAAFQLGRLSVAVFIVLSGYCLTASANRSGTPGVGSLPRFFLRRAWRILPPYYAALALSVGVILLVPQLDRRGGGHWDITLPVTIGSLGAHLLMIHNLSAGWAYKCNHAMWSVATECQIYVLFPLLLLPCLRRLGPATVAAAATAAGVACHYLAPALDAARPWYLGLFALGMVAALAKGSTDPLAAGPGRRWGRWTLVLTALVLALAGANGRLKAHPWLIDVATGGAAATLILYCRSLAGSAAVRQPLALAVLQSRAAVWMGVVSYSLYLIHPPVLAAIHLYVRAAGGSDRLQFARMLVLGTAGSVVAGAAFFYLVESYFLSGPPALAGGRPSMAPVPNPVVETLAPALA